MQITAWLFKGQAVALSTKKIKLAFIGAPAPAGRLASPFGRGAPNLRFGAERVFVVSFLYPLRQKSKIFASSPKGGAKAAFSGELTDKLNFAHSL